jgi:hypothetical protein
MKLKNLDLQRAVDFLCGYSVHHKRKSASSTLIEYSLSLSLGGYCE